MGVIKWEHQDRGDVSRFMFSIGTAIAGGRPTPHEAWQAGQLHKNNKGPNERVSAWCMIYCIKGFGYYQSRVKQVCTSD
jgi:hypothetical protein